MDMDYNWHVLDTTYRKELRKIIKVQFNKEKEK